MVELLLCIYEGRLAKKSILYSAFLSAATPNTFEIDYDLIGSKGKLFSYASVSVLFLSFYSLIIYFCGAISGSLLLMSLRILDETACTAELTILLMLSTYFCVTYCFSCMKDPNELSGCELLFDITGLDLAPRAPYFY